MTEGTRNDTNHESDEQLTHCDNWIVKDVVVCGTPLDEETGLCVECVRR